MTQEHPSEISVEELVETLDLATKANIAPWISEACREAADRLRTSDVRAITPAEQWAAQLQKHPCWFDPNGGLLKATIALCKAVQEETKRRALQSPSSGWRDIATAPKEEAIHEICDRLRIGTRPKPVSEVEELVPAIEKLTEAWERASQADRDMSVACQSAGDDLMKALQSLAAENEQERKHRVGRDAREAAWKRTFQELEAALAAKDEALEKIASLTDERGEIGQLARAARSHKG